MARRWTYRLAGLALVGLAVWWWTRRRDVEERAFDAASAGTTSPAPTAAPPAHERVDSDAPTWVAPVEGRCPDGHAVKVNERSGIFHEPGGRFYDRTVPDRCYATAAAAEADGYRRAKA